MKRYVMGALCALSLSPAQAAEPFRFEAEVSFDDMSALVRRDFSTSSTRDQVRAVFVEQGGAKLVPHPRKHDVEKYIYDIDLCSYYVWRWNISADYGDDGKLRQLYVNGSPRLGGAPEPQTPKKGPFYTLVRPRPQAYKGEKNLTAVVADRDGHPKTTDDMEILTGVGPTRADPLDMGRAVNEPGEVWRSIFDEDDAGKVVPWSGDCAKVDAEMVRRGVKLPPAAEAPPPPATIDDASVRAWLASYIKADGWTLIAADRVAVVLGSPKGVSQAADKIMTADIRHEYYRPVRLGSLDSRSNQQTWNIDCEKRRIRIVSMTIFEGSNLTGASEANSMPDAAWLPVAVDNGTRSRTVDRVCQAPTTGKRLN